jgi:phage tail tape-measure protein
MSLLRLNAGSGHPRRAAKLKTATITDTASKEERMHGTVRKLSALAILTIGFGFMIVVTGCSGGALTTREKGAGIGALGGAAAGGLIGAAVGHPGAGAAIGGGLGLGAGALIGDQLQGQQIRSQQQQRQIQTNRAEIDRQRAEIERIKRQQEY